MTAEADRAWKGVAQLVGGYADSRGRMRNPWRPVGNMERDLRRRVDRHLATYVHDCKAEGAHKPKDTQTTLFRLMEALAEVLQDPTALELLSTGQGNANERLWKVTWPLAPRLSGRSVTSREVVEELHRMARKAEGEQAGAVRIGRKPKAALRLLLRGLAYLFEITSGLRATYTPDGPFDRFCKAVLRYHGAVSGKSPKGPSAKLLQDILKGYRQDYPRGLIERLRSLSD